MVSSIALYHPLKIQFLAPPPVTDINSFQVSVRKTCWSGNGSLCSRAADHYLAASHGPVPPAAARAAASSGPARDVISVSDVTADSPRGDLAFWREGR